MNSKRLYPSKEEKDRMEATRRWIATEGPPQKGKEDTMTEPSPVYQTEQGHTVTPFGTWLAQIDMVRAYATAVYEAQCDLADAQQRLLDWDTEEVLPEILKGKDGPINGSNEATRKLQEQAFRNASDEWCQYQLAMTIATRELKRAEIKLDDARLMERYYRYQCAPQAAS